MNQDERRKKVEAEMMLEVEGEICKKRKEMEDELTEKMKLLDEKYDEEVATRSLRLEATDGRREREVTGGFRGDGRKKISKKARGGDREKRWDEFDKEIEGERLERRQQEDEQRDKRWKEFEEEIEQERLDRRQEEERLREEREGDWEKEMTRKREEERRDRFRKEN